MKKTSFVIASMFCLVGVQAQDTTHISLDKLLQQVETNYPSILQFQHNMEALQSKADGARAWMPPTFSTGLMRWPYSLSGPNEENDPMRQAGVAFSLEQMIPNASKLNAREDYIKSLAAVEESKREWAKNELRREAKILYSNRYVAEKKQKVLKESEELLKLLIETAEEKFSNNQSQLQTIYKAKARLAELTNMQLMLDGIIAESNIGLNILMVRDVGMHFKIDTLITLHNYSNSTAGIKNISNRSDVTALSNSINSMRLEQRVMKIGVRPDFGIRVEHMQMIGMPNQWSVMGMVTIPIAPWSSKMYLSEARSMGSQIQSMEKEKQTIELMASRSVSEKLSMLSYESALYKNYNENIIKAYENNLRATLLAYRQNTGDFIELLDAWETLLMKKLEAYDKLLNILKLESEYEYEKEIR
jgi:outer membrane protein, heavy metal efflux system